MVGKELLMMFHPAIHNLWTSLGLNFETNLWEPEVFLNQLFDNRMFTIMAEETNNYAHQQIMRIMGGRDQIQQIKHYSHKRHTRLGMWRDVNESDIRIFMTPILIMSSVRNPALHNYWSTKTLSRTPFFGAYLSRNKFQDIILCSFSKPGRVKFLQFNPSNPNKFHIKLFMVPEHKTGYMARFLVYTGKVANELVTKNAVSSKECTMTTKTIMGQTIIQNYSWWIVS